jgi:hypothetical protein
MTVEESAVIKGVVVSSACATDARLTNPTAANPAVHLFIFIYFSSSCDLFAFLMRLLWVKTVYPRTKTVHCGGQ